MSWLRSPLTPTTEPPTVSASQAAATADALVPTVSAAATATSPLATATADAFTPALLVTLVEPIATGTAASLVPSVLTSSTVTAPLATATAVAIVPASVGSDTLVTTPLATATGVGVVPVPAVTVLAPLTAATAAALVPLAAGSLAIISAPLAAATAAGIVPTIHTTNDNFADALLITGTSGTSGPIVIDAATVEVGEPTGSDILNGLFHTIWFKWVAPSNMIVEFDTEASIPRTVDSGDDFGHLDTTMGVWTGTALNDLVEVDSSDDFDTDNWYSRVQFLATGGATYYIQVGGFAADTAGDVTLTWSLVVVNVSLAPSSATATAAGLATSRDAALRTGFWTIELQVTT